MLTIRNFRKKYGDTLILSIPELTITTGAYWIKGLNGSGKTTLFKSLGGLIPCEGEIAFDDNVSLQKDPVTYRRRVNYSEAEPLYPGFLTPLELIRFVGKAKEASDDQQKMLMGWFGIDRFQHKACASCSSGMIKKVSLALAFLGNPRVIILDEPLITLDEESRQMLSALVRKYITEKHVAFLLSSHQIVDDSFITLRGSYEIARQTLVAI
ncbi:MAG: ATP-binding cassette domain-containing protein [Chryseolinea sp.]